MIKTELTARNIADIDAVLTDWFSSQAFSDDGFYIKRIERQDCTITIFVAEEYYFRINSTLTLTVIVEETVNETIVEIVSGGGREGLVGFSYGAEKSAMKRIVTLLKENGFREQ
ncbi:MAG: hypothetical protein IKI59_08980 [Clostridia bacterium]|nr:hypothetical protein [Clostridia bacterium]